MSHGHNRVHRLRARLPATDFLFEHNTPGAQPKKEKKTKKQTINILNEIPYREQFCHSF